MQTDSVFSRFIQKLKAWQVARSLPVASLYWGESGLWSYENARAGQRWPDFEQWCAAHPRQQVRIWVGGAWVHNVSVPADMPLADTQAVRAYARLQFVHYFGAAAQAWPLAVWSQGTQRNAVALQEQAGLSLNALTSAALTHGVRILSVRPAWSHALAQAAATDSVWAQAESSGLGLLEGRMLSWLSLARGKVVDVQQRYLDQGDAPELQSLLQRLQPASGNSHAPKLMGWGGDTTALTLDASIAEGPQSAHWLAAGTVN
ncbi:hypothetical protein [Roseateles albus]|uniref:hypothetical protein n=1 Tax=Roseateles albus TaxID=2987525 RepID=UPI002358BDE8|nr:hypothetical protein [Roseateles albus]